MTPLKVLIVDDEAPARSRLQDLLADCDGVTVAGEAADGVAALEFLAGHPVDAVLLDIRMPGIDGIQVAQHILNLAIPPAVIFTTAYDRFAVHAFEVHAVDYLVKPIRLARLQDALARARNFSPLRAETLREIAGARTHLSVHARGRIRLIPVGEVAYLRAELKYVTARTGSGEFVLEESLTRLEQEFAGTFVRIHRNCLVAKSAIAGFERIEENGDSRWTVMLKGIDEKLPVSRRQQHVVRELAKG